MNISEFLKAHISEANESTDHPVSEIVDLLVSMIELFETEHRLRGDNVGAVALPSIDGKTFLLSVWPSRFKVTVEKIK